MTLNTSMLEIAVNAAAGGHDLGGFETVGNAGGTINGYQAKCRLCGMTTWVGDNGLRNSLLDDICPGARK